MGPTFIYFQLKSRGKQQNQTEPFSIMCHAHTKTSVHPLYLPQIQEHHGYRGVKCLFSLSVRRCRWRT